MIKRKRKVLEMTRSELEAVVQIILPGRNIDSMSNEDLQEETIHWLLLNGLTLGHFFTIVEDEGQLGVLTDKGKCECCVASISKGLLGLPHGNSLKKAASAGIMQETSFSNDGRRVHSQSDLLNSKSPSRPDALPMKTIRTQPLPADHFNATSKGPSTNKPKKKREAEEEERNCCKQCCADWGQCCIGLMSGI